MGLGCRYFVGLVLLWFLGTALGQGDFRRVSFSVLQHGYEYDCGDYGMQLLVFPSQDRTIRFKVVGLTPDCAIDANIAVAMCRCKTALVLPGFGALLLSLVDLGEICQIMAGNPNPATQRYH
ncbi:zona pellucida sperm-binding protein 1-like [Platysternon megacephalum]|uniref:Zona pellucida sperm-binding protein 1-like n=1 Tax=Platysternon megacephalum TaxID=55544 RepID=A0A4D9DSV2_9SAUR|nr:zona pellucida sperm-binding protein 1-like [Platysternon megacephalum]